MDNSCRYYVYEAGLFTGGNYCNVSGRKERISEDYYNRYCRHDYNMRDCPLHKKYGPYMSPSTCFITTVVHDILGKKDDDKLLNNLIRFRDNILQKDKKYAELLQDYDNIGPIIADCIWCDKDAEQMANGIYDIALVPISQMIENKEYDKACEKYYLLTLSLINYYGLKHKYNHDKDLGLYENDFDINKSGHGGKRLVKNV